MIRGDLKVWPSGEKFYQTFQLDPGGQLSNVRLVLAASKWKIWNLINSCCFPLNVPPNLGGEFEHFKSWVVWFCNFTNIILTFGTRTWQSRYRCLLSVSQKFFPWRSPQWDILGNAEIDIFHKMSTHQMLRGGAHNVTARGKTFVKLTVCTCTCFDTLWFQKLVWDL